MATRQAVNNTRATTPVSVPEITRIQVEGNDTVSFLYGAAPPYQWVRGMSQIMDQNPAYISYRYDTITISQVAGESFTFTIYSITDVGGNTFTALTSQDPSDVVLAKTQEIYRLLVTAIFKGCCECGNTEPECSIQYTSGNGEDAGTLLIGEGSIQINYFTSNNQDFTGFWPIIQDGSWIFIFSKTDPTVYGVFQLSNYSDGGAYALFDITLLAGTDIFPEGTSLCVDVTSVGGSLVQDWQDTLNISSLLTQDNLIDGGGFNFEWGNVDRYILNSFNYQSYIADDGAGSVGQVYIEPGAVTISGTNFIDVITPGYATATPGMVLALDASGHVEYTLAGTGTISSIGLYMPPAFTVSTPNPLTSNGDFTVTGAGTALEYIDGTGNLQTLPVYTVENGLHAYGGVPGESPADPYLFHLGGVLLEDTLITATEVLPGPTYNEWVLGVAGLVGQDTRQPFAVSNLGNGGVASFQDYGSGSRPNPSVEIVGDVDLIQPLLELNMEGDLPDANNTLLRLRYSGTPGLANTTIDYQFRNNNAVAANSNFIGSRLSTEVVNFVDNNEETRFNLQLIEGGTLANKLQVQGYGQLVLNEYGPSVFSDGVSNIDNDLEYVLAVDASGNVYKKLSEGGGTVTEVDATGLLTTSPNPITTTGTVTSEMNSGFLVGRYDAGVGVFQEITVGTGLTLSATGELSADGSVPAFDGDQGVYKDTSLTPETFMLGAPNGSQAGIAFSIDRYIDTSTKFLSLSGTGSFVLKADTNAFLGVAVYGNADSGYGVRGSSNDTNSFGVWGGSKNGVGVYGESTNGYALFTSTTSSVNTLIRTTLDQTSLLDVVKIERLSSGPIKFGGGSSIATTLGTVLGSRISTYVSNGTTGEISLAFQTRKDTVTPESTNMVLIGDGQLQLNKYGQTPANFPDAAPVWALGVDASGNVVEIDPGGGGTTYDGKEGIYKDTSVSPETFMLGAPVGLGNTISFSQTREIVTKTSSLNFIGKPNTVNIINVTGASGTNTSKGIAVDYSAASKSTAFFGNVSSGSIGIEIAGQGQGFDIKQLVGSVIDTQNTVPGIADVLTLNNSSNQITGDGVRLNLNSATIESYYTDNSTESNLRFSIKATGNTSPYPALELDGTKGQVIFNEYGQTPANFPDASPVWALGVDASGNVVEFTPSGGGTTYNGDQGIYKDTSLTPETFMLGAPSGSETGIAFAIDRYVYTDDHKLALRGNPIDNAVTTANGSVLEVSLDASTAIDYIAGIKVDTTLTEAKSYGIVVKAASFGMYVESAAESITTISPGLSLVGTTKNNSNLSGIDETIRIIRDTIVGGGSPSIGFGNSIVFQFNDSNFIAPTVNSEISSYYSNVTLGSQSTDMRFTVTQPNGAGPGNPFPSSVMTLKGQGGEGQVQFNKYTTATAFQGDSGASIGVLNVDNAGNVFVGTGGGSSSPLTTKGDLYTYDTADARLPVGTDGQMLYADSTTATGLKWDDAPTGGIPFGIATGTDTYAVSAGTASTYTDGDAYLVRFTNGNTGASTLNVNGIGVADMYSNSDGLLIGGDIWAGAQMLCIYNSSLPGFQCIGTSTNSLFAYVTNAEATTITKGTAVYASGGTGDRMTVMKALATGDSTSALTVGIVFADIAAGQKGIILIQGELVGLNLFPTSGQPVGQNWSDGDPIYLSSTVAGGVTRVKQYAPNHLVYLGICVKASNGSAGRMYVRIQNGYELDEIHNVQAQSPNDKDVLWYDSSVTPTPQWKTASIPTILGMTTVGNNLITLPNPSAVRYIKIKSDNTVEAISLATLKSDLGLLRGVQTSTLTNSSTAANTNITGCILALDANSTYIGRLVVSSGFVSTTGFNLLFTFPAGSTMNVGQISSAAVGGQFMQWQAVTSGAALTNRLNQANNQTGLATIEIFISTAGTSGNLTPAFVTSSNGSTATVYGNATFIQLEKI